MGPREAFASDPTYLPYLVCQLVLFFGYAIWFFANYNRLVGPRSGLPVYYSFVWRLAPLMILSHLAWLAFRHFAGRGGA